MKKKEFELLARYTTMKVGGEARYFFIATSIRDIREAVLFAQKKKLPFFILGGGSNIVFSDTGFSGVIIKMETKGVKWTEEDAKYMRVVAEAGEVWDDLVAQAVSRNLWGLENLSLIPGTVGAAPIQNIGAYGKEVKDVIEWVEVFDVKKMTTRVLTNTQCKFGYRDSIFKKKKGKDLIVLRVSFLLSKEKKPSLEYKDIQEWFSVTKKPKTLKQIRNAVVSVRSRKLPNLSRYGTVGSFFKNPVISKELFQKIQKKYPEIKGYVEPNGCVKISAAWLIDQVGSWKGVRAGNVGTYQKHALVIVAYKHATAIEIFSFSEKIINDVKNKTGVTLEREPVCFVETK